MSTFNAPDDVQPLTKISAADLNAIVAAVGAAFGLIPDETVIKTGKVNWGTDTGVADAYVVALPYAPTTYTAGLTVRFIPLATNTGASTINVNSLGVKSVRDPVGAALAAGLITIGVPCELVYSTTTGYFHMIGALSPQGPAGPPGGMTSVDISGGATGLTATGGPITSSGTITLGGLLGAAYGGSGVSNNAASTVTITGAYGITWNLGGVTALTLPQSGTLATLTGTEELTNKTITGGTFSGGTATSLALTSPAITGGTAAGLTAFAIRNAGTGAYDMTQAHNGTLTAGRTLTWNLNDAARSISLTGNLSLAAGLTTSGAFASTFTMTGVTAVTFPESGTLATKDGAETFTNKTLTSPAINTPTIAGGTHTALTGLGIRNAGTGAFDMTVAHNGTLTAGRTLTWNLNDAARSITLAGNITTTGAVTFSGAFASTFTLTNTTTVTFPTTGTLATLAGAEALTNKTLGAGSVLGADVTGGDFKITRAMLIDCGATYLDKGNSGTSTQTLDYTAGSHQKITTTGNHTIATSNWPPTGNLGSLLLELVNGAANTITWPTVNWVKSDGSTTTTFSSNGVTLQTSGTDWVLLWSRDAGTTIYGKIMR